MARLPRRLTFDPAVIGIYHCINRCVRRAYLCGVDQLSGKSYEHRRQWLQDKLEFIAGVMGCDILGFAVMSNHFHLVVRNRPDVVANWSDEDVARRWYQLCPVRREPGGAPVEPTAADLGLIVNNSDRLAEIRLRLSSVSWLMRFLTEPIARRANEEEQSSGRFWQGRFRLQRLLDEAAVAACLVYVDLNPIRAGIAATPEESRFTSVYERIRAAVICASARTADAISAEQCAAPRPAASIEPVAAVDQPCRGAGSSLVANNQQAPREERLMPEPKPASKSLVARPAAEWLSPLEVSEQRESQPTPSARASNKGCLEMSLADYLELVEWSGRQWRADKRGAIDAA
ncbi:MAG: hypothetical protein EHM42_06790, partial [Planctomycetaceae bacterium]